MQMIVAVDENWAIGLNGGLLVRIPGDMEWFRKKTTGKVVVMGRKTLESLPGGQPLGKRTNIILSRDPKFQRKNAVTVPSFSQAMELLKQYDPEDIYVIGGESIYRQFLPYADTIHVTKIMYQYQADTFFQIWIRWKNGKWRRKAKSRRILTWSIFQKYVRKKNHK